MIRIVLAVASLMLLSACNVVMTKTPLFAKADTAASPKLRPGLWAENPNTDCALDETKPLADWPSCANGFVVIDDTTVGGYGDQGGAKVFQTTSALVVAGDPLIFQVHAKGQQNGGPDTDAYIYAGMEATKRDDKGRVIATRTWAVLCGPPPPDSAKLADGSQRYGTLAPFAGMTMDASNNDCSTTSQAALHAAAKASHQYADAGPTSAAHWVRDGDK
jgi:hypothetical protein